MEKEPGLFYKQQFNRCQLEIKTIKRELFWLGMLRLSVFFVTIGAIYFLADKINLAVITGIAGLALFLFLVSRNTDFKLKKKKQEKLAELNELEMNVLKGNLENLPSGTAYVSENHFYNQDIDLFGIGSIFQYINRTSIKKGEEHLAFLLNSNGTNRISEKQEAIKELSILNEWRQNFQITSALINTKIESSQIVSWLSSYTNGIPNFFNIFTIVFSSISVLLFISYGLSLISDSLIITWFFIGLGISGIYFKRVSKLYKSSGKMMDTFRQYAELLEEIENCKFEASLLKEQQQKIQLEKSRASVILKQLSKELNSLDQRNNFLFAFIANGFFLWDLRYSCRIEKWIKDYKKVVHNWFDAIEFFDAYNSLGNYAFNYPNHVFPTLTSNQNEILKSKDLGHPLLKDSQRVTNDFEIKKEDFIIITGANMAGKSTFLRTVALNIVLANIGLPVCAKTFVYSPIKLISSMRTSDSLQNDESYFFSELKRLKFIIDQLKQETYFVILDEILKGTNSKDKAEGSKKFVEKLVKTNSTGIIATHDLSLCELSESISKVANRYFDAEIVNDELFFDYKFKNGICKNMNASFLLKKMEIV